MVGNHNASEIPKQGDSGAHKQKPRPHTPEGRGFRVKAPASSAQKKPRRSGVPTGASRLHSVCGGDDPHVAMVLQRRRLQRVLAITVQCKTRETKRKVPPARGLMLARLKETIGLYNHLCVGNRSARLASAVNDRGRRSPVRNLRRILSTVSHIQWSDTDRPWSGDCCEPRRR